MALSLLSSALGLHEWSPEIAPSVRCVPPGQCSPPASKYSKVVAGPQPGQQWNINGGFCGAFSTQHAALGAGAWISQDLVRKSNREQPGSHHMHGDRTVGFEVMPSNVAYTATALKLAWPLGNEWRPSIYSCSHASVVAFQPQPSKKLGR